MRKELFYKFKLIIRVHVLFIIWPISSIHSCIYVLARVVEGFEQIMSRGREKSCPRPFIWLKLPFNLKQSILRGKEWSDSLDYSTS